MSIDSWAKGTPVYQVRNCLNSDREVAKIVRSRTESPQKESVGAKGMTYHGFAQRIRKSPESMRADVMAFTLIDLVLFCRGNRHGGIGKLDVSGQAL